MNQNALPLYPDHVDDLRRSGLGDEIIMEMGLYSVAASGIPKLLGWSPASVESALIFPYPGTDGFVRLKLFPSVTDEEGHTIKYLQPKGTGVRLYVLSKVATCLKDPSVPLAVVEGEKKCAATVQAGLMAVGVGGVWNWLRAGTCQPIPEIDDIAWVEREVTLYFDSDIWSRPDLLKPVYALGKELAERGANVQVAVLEQKGEGKAGLDDLLVAAGPDALEQLKCVPLTHGAFNQAKSWWKQWKRRKTPSSRPVARNLTAAVHAIRRLSSQEALGFEKKRQIADLVTEHLAESGRLYRTPEQRRYFFDNGTRTLMALEEEPFIRYLADRSGLNPTEVEFRYLQEHLLNEAHHRGTEAPVYHLAHYDVQTHRVFVTDCNSGVWVLDGHSVSHVANGEDGVLFAAYQGASPYEYLPRSARPTEATVRQFLEPIPFDSNSRMAPGECSYLMFLWLLSLFFPELHRTKVIPVFIGQHGSTKTTTARRFGVQLFGEQFEVGGLESGHRGEQAFIAAMCHKPFCVFDNADAPIKWLHDRLATFATGSHFELRELYTTNQLVTYRPVAHLMLNSRDPHFRRPDVAERLLICRLQRVENFIPESEIFAQTLDQRNAVWSDLLDLVNQTLLALKEVPTAPTLPYRMADFASFGWRVSRAQGGPEAANQFLDSLNRLVDEQANYTTEDDPVAVCLAAWLDRESNLDREMTTAELFTELGEVAKTQGLLLPKTSAAMGRRLHASKRALELALGVRLGVRATGHTSFWKLTRPSRSVADFQNPALPALPSQPMAEG